MHITPLLSYCTADFPVYLSSAPLPEGKLASLCASSQIPSQKLKCRSCKIQLYLPHSSLPVFHRPYHQLLSKSLRFKTLTVPLPFIPKVHWKCLNIYMSESVNHVTNIYDYIRARNYIAIYYYIPIQTIVRSNRRLWSQYKFKYIIAYMHYAKSHSSHRWNFHQQHSASSRKKKPSEQSESTSLYATGTCNYTA